jgi:hypothetical protein
MSCTTPHTIPPCDAAGTCLHASKLCVGPCPSLSLCLKYKQSYQSRVDARAFREPPTLTLFAAWTCAPASSSLPTNCGCPFPAATWSGVFPSCNARSNQPNQVTPHQSNQPRGVLVSCNGISCWSTSDAKQPASMALQVSGLQVQASVPVMGHQSAGLPH